MNIKSVRVFLLASCFAMVAISFSFPGVTVEGKIILASLSVGFTCYGYAIRASATSVPTNQVEDLQEKRTTEQPPRQGPQTGVVEGEQENEKGHDEQDGRQNLGNYFKDETQSSHNVTISLFNASGGSAP